MSLRLGSSDVKTDPSHNEWVSRKASPLFCVNIYMTEIEVNGVKASVENGYSRQGLYVGQKVTLFDEFGIITPNEAENLVRYLFLEGFINSMNVYIDVVNK